MASREHGQASLALVDICTVDGFQGREKEVIIVSAVRADTQKKSIGFLRDIRRMNVAFTRPRRSLWVVGHGNVLAQNDNWGAFLEFAQQHCSTIKVTGLPKEKFLYRWLHSHFGKNKHLTPPAKLADLPEPVVSAPEGVVVADEDMDMSAEEIKELLEEAEMRKKYSIADASGDIEDEYTGVSEMNGMQIPEITQQKPTPMDVEDDTTTTAMDVDTTGAKKDDDDED